MSDIDHISTLLDLVRATDRQLDAARPAGRPWFCAGCGGDAVAGYSLCEPCQRESVNRKRAEMVGKARATLPTGTLAACFGTETLRGRLCPGNADRYRAAVMSAWTWVQDPTDTLLILGGAGRGKTSLAAAVALALLDAGGSADASHEAYDRARRLLWSDVVDVAQARRRHSLGDGEAPHIRAAIAASVLVVDELGTEKPDTASGTDPVRDVLWARFSERRPTVATSPFDRATLAARYGGGGERRLFEAPRATLIDLGGGS